MKKLLLISAIVSLFILPVFASADIQPATLAPGQSIPVSSASNYVIPTGSVNNGTTITAPSNCSNGQPPPVVNGVTQGCSLGYTPLEPVPGLTSGFDFTNPANLPQIISAIFKILITVGALFAVLNLTIGGIQYMTAEAVGNKTGGIKRAQNALWAILLIAMSWLILNTINPNLLKFTFAPPCIGNGTGNGCTVNSTPTQNSAFSTGSVSSSPSLTQSDIQTFAAINSAGNVSAVSSAQETQALQDLKASVQQYVTSNNSSVVVSSAFPYQDGTITDADKQELTSQCEGTGFLGYKLTTYSGSNFSMPGYTVYSCNRPPVY